LSSCSNSISLEIQSIRWWWCDFWCSNTSLSLLFNDTIDKRPSRFLNLLEFLNGLFSESKDVSCWRRNANSTVLYYEAFVLYYGLRVSRNVECSTQEEVLVSTEIDFDISPVLKKSCLRKLTTSPRKLLYYLSAIRSRIDADKARPVDKQLVTNLRKTSF